MSLIKKNRRAMLLATLAVALNPLPSALAQTYPSRPVRIIVPLPPGGGLDFVARTLAAKIAPRLGQTILVENKPGAGTSMGTEAAARSAPDGYTFFLSPIGSQAIMHVLNPKLPFNMQRDFDPVARIAYGTIVLVVPQASPAKTVAELVAMAKAQPGKMNFASSGAGGIIHLTGEMFKQATKTDITHVPYKGSAQILPDLLEGRIDMTLDSLPVYLTHIKSGKLRALAVATPNRSPLIPEIPTLAEIGVPGVVSTTDYALFAPVGSPKEAITRMHSEIIAALALPDVRATLAARGIDPAPGNPEALRTELADEISKWRKVINASNISIE